MSDRATLDAETVFNEPVYRFASEGVASVPTVWPQEKAGVATLFSDRNAPPIHSVDEGTGFSFERLSAHAQGIANGVGCSVDAKLRETLDHRISLVVEKFEGAFQRESAARLHILTQRLRRLAPRVVQGDLEQVSGLLGELESFSERLKEIRKTFGVK